jgi:DNA-3-methyladenine glycosylase II
MCELPLVRKNSRIPAADFATCAIALSKSDRKLAKIITRVGPVLIEVPKRFDPFHSLARSIVYQQLSGKAAATIFGRVQAAVGSQKDFTPDNVQKVSDETLRGAGLSRAKLAALRDLSEKTLDGIVPDFSSISKLSDAEIIARLTAIRGVGQWTVEMLLMFSLGRPDVLPVSDLGIRKGFQKVYGGDEMPSPKALAQFGEKWGPHRTTAAWYLWRALELK